MPLRSCPARGRCLRLWSTGHGRITHTVRKLRNSDCALGSDESQVEIRIAPEQLEPLLAESLVAELQFLQPLAVSAGVLPPDDLSEDWDPFATNRRWTGAHVGSGEGSPESGAMVVNDVSVHSKPDGMIVSFVRTHQRCPENILSFQDAQEVATNVAGRDSGVAGPHIAGGPITMEAIPFSDGNCAEARVGLPVSLVLVPTDGDERRRRQSATDRGHRVSYGERIPVEKQNHIIGICNG